MGLGNRITVGLIFGGRSGEHEVSVDSARSVLQAIDREKYEVLPIRISRSGKWDLLPTLQQLDGLEDLGSLAGEPADFSPDAEGGRFVPVKSSGADGPVDVVFPLVHGVQGEDGALQGLLTLADVPYVGAGVLASAVGMDKIVMKHLFIRAGLRAPPFLGFSRWEWRNDPDRLIREIETSLGYPCFVKPANTGSSVGIEKVQDRAGLPKAIESAFRLDLKVIVEKYIDARELECGVLGNDEPEASVVGEVIPAGEFYDYASKYQDEGTRVVIPAELEPELGERIRQWSVRAFQATCACGMARVDFFLERKTGQLYLNEINTIPGFTPRSMFPMLWQASGVEYPKLIDRLIELALQRYEERPRQEYKE